MRTLFITRFHSEIEVDSGLMSALCINDPSWVSMLQGVEETLIKQTEMKH